MCLEIQRGFLQIQSGALFTLLALLTVYPVFIDFRHLQTSCHSNLVFHLYGELRIVLSYVQKHQAKRKNCVCFNCAVMKRSSKVKF